MGAKTKPDLDLIVKALEMPDDEFAVEAVMRGMAVFERSADEARVWRGRLQNDPACCDALTRTLLAALDASQALQDLRIQFVDRMCGFDV